jgi:hypothetical protein
MEINWLAYGLIAMLGSLGFMGIYIAMPVE